MWTKEEVQLLIDNAHQSLETLEGMFPTKSRDAIRNKRSRLKRSPKVLKPWTEEERKFLAENYHTLSMDELLEHFKPRTESAIRSQVHYLKARNWRFKDD